MAIFHLDFETLSRSEGRNAAQFCAYITGTRIADPWSAAAGISRVFDHSRKQGVIETGIVGWDGDVVSLAEGMELSETRINSAVVQTIEAALPHELTRDQNLEICREFSAWIVERYGAAALWAAHKPDARGSQKNIHMHINFSCRKTTLDRRGFGAKVRELDSFKTRDREVTAIREAWANHVNRALTLAGRPERIGAAKLDIPEAMKSVHLGAEATAKERRGERTEKGDHNRRVDAHRVEARAEAEKLRRLQRELQEVRDEIKKALIELRNLMRAELGEQERVIQAKAPTAGAARKSAGGFSRPPPGGVVPRHVRPAVPVIPGRR